MLELVRLGWRTHYLRMRQELQLGKRGSSRQDNKLALNNNSKYVTNFKLQAFRHLQHGNDIIEFIFWKNLSAQWRTDWRGSSVYIWG